MAETEQNKSEEATPFKLKRAREKGTVARGMDLGFFACLAGLGLFWFFGGASATRQLLEMMRRQYAIIADAANDPSRFVTLAQTTYMPALHSIGVLCGAILLTVLLFEIIQLRGLIFTTQPLKPDFNRLNPGKNLKRLFSARMLKETAKNIIKLGAYSGAAYLVIHDALLHHPQFSDFNVFVSAMGGAPLKLLLAFILLALLFAAIDQMLVRRDFSKQMRMSRSEVTREFKDREGDPRLKQRRKQLHAEFAKQMQSIGDLRGTDILVVNPQHYAIGLSYDTKTMSAPKVTAKARNRLALLLKQRAASLSIAIYEQPALARALFRTSEKGSEIAPLHYRAVADLYLALAARSKSVNADA